MAKIKFVFPSFQKQIWIWKRRRSCCSWRLCRKSDPCSGSGLSHPNVPRCWGPGQCHQKQAELTLMKPESSAPAATNKSDRVLCWCTNKRARALRRVPDESSCHQDRKAGEVSHLLVRSRLSLQRRVSFSFHHRGSRAPPTGPTGSPCSPLSWSSSSPAAASLSPGSFRVSWFKKGRKRTHMVLRGLQRDVALIPK